MNTVHFAEARGFPNATTGTRMTLGLLIFAAVAPLALAASGGAQVVVVGTGDPDIDAPAVQAAVDQGGEVILQGHFSFNRPPTVPTALAQAGYPPATVLVSHAVTISGVRGEDDHWTTIEGGTIPFYVEAPGVSVTIEAIRFVRPTAEAILVYAVSGLRIASCKIEAVEPVNHISTGIGIKTTVTPPTPAHPGHPEHVSGALLIVNNDIDLAGGTALDNTLGVTLFSVGVPGAGVEAYVSANTIRNSTARTINIYQVGGRAYVERNVITTSTIVGPAHVTGCTGTDVIHVSGTGSYLVAGNSIDSRWATGGGIRVHGQQSVWPIKHAIVVDNDVNMEAPESTVFDECSAGIDIFGFAQDNVVLGNRIRGRARGALSVDAFRGGMPDKNALVLNRFDHFEASLADVLVGDGVTNTLVAGQGGTVIGPLTLWAASGTAQQHQHGKSEKLGVVHFTTSCNAGAQKEFDRAVALLHSFQFNHAIEGFNAALKSDAACGIAYWGIALSQWSNPFAAGMKDKGQLQAGRESAERGKAVGAKTEREQAYIGAVDKLYDNFESTPQQSRLISYRDAMGQIAEKYSADHEAQIFYALALAASEEPTDKTHAGRLKAGAILEKLFREEPDHPGLAHYIIHTYDVPALAGRALNAARRYSEIAPDAPHALHMPSHTFTRVGHWQDSINSNRAAAAASRREGQTAEELHASDYQIYAYLQTAQDEAARKLLESLPEIASRFDPKVVISGAAPPSAGYFALAAIPARYALERRDWKRAAELEPHETPFPYTEAMTWFARGMGAARLHDTAKAQASVKALQEIRTRLEKASESYWAGQVEIQRLEVDAWKTLAEGRNDQALAMMKTAAEMEDGTDKSAVTPGPLAPARELLGEMLLEMNQLAQALEQFEATLKKEPNRFRALYGAARAARLSRNRVVSRKYFRELLKICENADKPGRVEILEANKAISGN